MQLRLVIVGVEAAELHIEDLTRDAEAGLSADDPGDGLQRSPNGLSVSLFVIGSRYCGGLGIPLAPAGSIEIASVACAWIERWMTTSYSLAKRFCFVGAEDRVERVGTRRLPNKGCARPPMGIGPAECS